MRNTFAVRAIGDFVAPPPPRFVRLRISLNGVSETIVCPPDFGSLIEQLRDYKPGHGVGIAIRGKHGLQLQRLGLAQRIGSGTYWFSTSLLRKHADALVQAFEKRWSKIVELAR